MRKTLLTSLCLLLGVVSTWASIWQPKTSQDYLNEKAYFVRLVLNPEPDPTTAPPQVELAAFIDGDCRALATWKNQYGYYELRVVGDLEEDLDKDIVFKAFVVDDNGYGLQRALVYEFTKKGKFDSADGEFDYPLTLDLLQNITLDDPITIEAALPVVGYDLTQHFNFHFGTQGGGTSANVKLETPMTYVWTPAETENIESIVGNILTSKDVSTEEPESLTVNITGQQYVDDLQEYPTFWDIHGTNVVIKAAQNPITSITLSQSTVEALVGDDLQAIINAARASAVIEPADASNKELGWDIEDKSWFDAADSVITARGTYMVTIKSMTLPLVTADLTIVVRQRPSFTVPDAVTLSLLGDSVMTFTAFNDPDNLFDPTKIRVKAAGEMSNGDSPFKATVADDGLSCTLRGKYAGVGGYRVFYDDTPMSTESGDDYGTVYVEPLIALPTGGWGWVSVCYIPSDVPAIPLTNMTDGSNADFMANVVEMRTQDALLYNYEGTLYGGLLMLNPQAGMIKVRGTDAESSFINLGWATFNRVAEPDGMSGFEQTVAKGYNWITYPYEFNLELSEVDTPNPDAVEGDMIIGQTTAATFDGTEWVTTDGFKFEAGKGYIYYSNSDEANIQFSFAGIPLCYQDTPAPNNARRQECHPWQLQNKGFADNMVAIVRFEGLQDPENYVIGAFVGDECRGQGSVVKGDIMMLCVAGQGGDKVSYRLYDKTTGEEIAISETVSYGPMSGTISAPKVMRMPVVTGIGSRTAVTKAEGETVYSLSGQQLTAPRKGINIIGGKKIIK